jgi:hypothetical protein
MPSRLSSLLVRDGLVGVKRMEKAFQRQVIYGGSLDTIMLEMNFVREERLTQYLSLASGLPPAARDEAEHVDADAVALLSREVADQFRAVPLTVAGDALRVLVCSPLEMKELEDLADLLDRALQPLITPEYRWHLAFAKAFTLEAPARFTTLARQVAADEGPSPVGRARSVIVDSVPPIIGAARSGEAGPIDDRSSSGLTPIALQAHSTLPLVTAPPRLPAAPDSPPEITQPLTIHVIAPAVVPTPATPVVAPVPDDDPTMPINVVELDSRSRHDTLVGVMPNRANAPVVVATPRTAKVLTPSSPDRAAPPYGGAEDPSSGVPNVMSESERTKLPAPPSREASGPIATSGRDSPLAIVRARELLATAEDRDTVFLTLLRAARGRARYAALLTVQGGAAIGRIALAEPGIDVAGVERVLIPLDAMTPFRNVVQTQQPHIGALASRDPTVDAMVLRLGGTMPPSALIMPIVLRDRAVALLVAHRVHSDLRLIDITELLPLASAASDALGRLIVKHKSAGYRAPSPVDVVVVETDLVDTKRLARSEGEWRAPAPAERPSLPPLDRASELSVTTQPPRPIEAVIDTIEIARDADAEDAITDAVERASETLGEIVRRFPGKLRVDRFAVTGRVLRAAQYGGLLDLVVRLGAAASELLIEKMSAPQRDVRFYATICAAELRPRNAVYALVERLFDQDFGVRAAAVEALSGYPVADLTQALARGRRALHSSDPDVVTAAASALVQLGDVEAVGDLIEVIERADRATEHVRRALVALTAQDFATSERKWKKWWEAARRRHRVEWLIDGLAHKDEQIRERAISDLRRLTGEYFGYHHDLPKKEREAAAERWSVWWRETGRQRFAVTKVDERGRPTALLPSRRDE